jgi:hypothetical protein
MSNQQLSGQSNNSAVEEERDERL